MHGEAGRVGNPGIWLRATTGVLAHSQCKLIVMVGSQGGVDFAIQVRLLQLMHVDQTLMLPLRPLPVLGSEILSIKWSCFSAASKNIATGNTMMSESCVYSPTRSSMCIYLFPTHTCCYYVFHLPIPPVFESYGVFEGNYCIHRSKLCQRCLGGSGRWLNKKLMVVILGSL